MTARCLLTVSWVVLGSCVASSAEGPRIVREDIEWLDVWVPDVNTRDLPRVLLIGDSITRGYGPLVEQQLKGTASVARLATSKSVGDPALSAEIALVLGQAHFDVIHFNNGLHGWGYTEAEYRAHFPELLKALRAGAPGAKLIWATITPVREPADLRRFSPRTERVRARNRIAGELVTGQGIAVDDLFTLVVDHPEYAAGDGVHFHPQGTAALAEQVARRIRDVLEPAADDRSR